MLKRGINLSLVILLTLNSCSVFKKSANERKSSEKVSFVKIKIIYPRNDNYIDFQVVNTSKKKEIFVFHPKELKIEYKSGKNWEKVPLLYCPCGASCPPPPEKEILKPKADIVFSWNKKKSWCGKLLKSGIRKYHEEDVPEGTYRFVLDYAFNNKNPQVLYKKFNIKK